MKNELHKNVGVKAFIKGVMYADEKKYNKNLTGWLGPLPKEFREQMERIIISGVTRDDLIKILRDMNLCDSTQIHSQITPVK